MSAKRKREQLVTRRYVRAVVQRARDDIISAVVHAPRSLSEEYVAQRLDRVDPHPDGSFTAWLPAGPGRVQPVAYRDRHGEDD